MRTSEKQTYDERTERVLEAIRQSKKGSVTWKINAAVICTLDGLFEVSVPEWHWSSEALDADDVERLILEEARRRVTIGLGVFVMT